MASEDSDNVEIARTATAESIPALLSSPSETVLRALIDNPAIDVTHMCILLERKDLPGTLLEEIANRKRWRANHCIRRALAGHPRTPRLVAIRLLRDLHLMDLVRISRMPAAAGELRRLAEERVLAQLPQLSRGQKLMLARRGSARVAAGVVAQGPEQAARIGLDNSLMTESQVLKTIAMESLPPQIVELIANHEKWSNLPNVRVALLRHPQVPLARVLAFVPDLPRHDLEGLLENPQIEKCVRDILHCELTRRRTL